MANSLLIQHVAPLHTADEMRAMSDLAHSIVGALLALAAAAALAQAVRRPWRGAALLFWPGLIGAAGLFLLVYLLFPHHGSDHALEQWRWVFTDGQQRQHVVLGSLALAAGAAEIWSTRRAAAALKLVWPGVAALAGLAFLAVHPQHGASSSVHEALLVHRLIGGLLVATGAFRCGEIAFGARWLGPLWPLTLLGAALLLLTYREPPGAFTGAATNTSCNQPLPSSGRVRSMRVKAI